MSGRHFSEHKTCEFCFKAERKNRLPKLRRLLSLLLSIPVDKYHMNVTFLSLYVVAVVYKRGQIFKQLTGMNLYTHGRMRLVSNK